MLDFLLGNDLLSAILAFAIVLIPAVIVHELGHFLTAKAVGITILEFGVGFPPRIAKLFTWRETDFTLNAIPLGGFVRPLGEDMIRPLGEEETEQDRQKLMTARQEKQAKDDESVRASQDKAQEDISRSEREMLRSRGFEDIKGVYDVKPLPRIFFMAGGALANFIFAFFVFILVGLLGIPEVVGAHVGFANVPAGSALEALNLQAGDFIESVNGEYYESQAMLFSRLNALEGQTATLRIRRTAPGAFGRFSLEAPITAELIAMFEEAVPGVLVTLVRDESPGFEAGIAPGDYVIAFNGNPLTLVEDAADSLLLMTNRAAGEEARLTILRDGEILELTVTPRLDPPPGDGRIGIGIMGQFVNLEMGFGFAEFPLSESVPQSIGASVNYAVERFTTVFQIIVEFPARLLQGSTQPEERRIVSVVGVSQLGGVILQNSIEDDQASPFLDYVALISIALGFTNLLPIPALDGGRIVFAVLELIRGKPVPPEQEGFVHLVGVIFILSLGVFVIINDIVNPITNIIP